MPELICASKGPRIGDDGMPRCKRPLGHPGSHMPDPEDGWRGVSWGDPVMPDMQLRQEYADFGWGPCAAPESVRDVV